MLGLASVSIVSKKYDEARALYVKLAELKPDSAEVLFNAGLLEQKAENHEAAAELYKKAVGVRSDLAEAHLNLAVALQAIGDEEEAVGHFEKAIEIKPQLAKGYFKLKPMRRAGRMQAKAEPVGA